MKCRLASIGGSVARPIYAIHHISNCRKNNANMPDTFRLGTRTSKLALWQAHQVGNALNAKGYTIRYVEIQSEGDIRSDIPLDQFGVPGVFTDRFDRALYDDEIDLAVHSLKDYPATIPNGLAIGAHLKRDNAIDTLVLRKPVDHLDATQSYLIATSSSRRKAQWLSRYPQSTMTDLRGNVPTRLAKLYESDWDGAIFARAGLDRLGLRPPHTIDLSWMIPAPAQAVIAAVCRANDEKVLQALGLIDHEPTAYVATVERNFLAGLGGGCESPIGALAILHESLVHFKGCIFHRMSGIHYNIDTTRERISAQRLAQEMVTEISKQFQEDGIPNSQNLTL